MESEPARKEGRKEGKEEGRVLRSRRDHGMTRRKQGYALRDTLVRQLAMKYIQ